VVDQLWVVGISGGSVEFGNLIPAAKRSAISVRHPVALSRWRRGRKGTVTLVGIGDLERSLG
jgi:hypothetical protein